MPPSTYLSILRIFTLASAKKQSHLSHIFVYDIYTRRVMAPVRSLEEINAMEIAVQNIVYQKGLLTINHIIGGDSDSELNKHLTSS